jgi:hypothetical protein
VLVLEHSGVCLPRQYRTFSGIAHGRETHRFFAKLIAGGFATTDLVAAAHAGRLYHLQYKPWYRVLGEPDHRHRRPMSVGRAVERLMVLDGVLAEADVTWLGLAQDKVATSTAPPFCVPLDGVLAEAELTWLGLARDKAANRPFCVAPAVLPQTRVGNVVRPLLHPCPIDVAPDESCAALGRYRRTRWCSRRRPPTRPASRAHGRSRSAWRGMRRCRWWTCRWS